MRWIEHQRCLLQRNHLLESSMADKKVIFIAFAIEDENQRNLFTGQRLHPRNPYEFTDMSVKEPYSTEWKERVRTRIKRSDGVIVLVSKNSTSSEGQKWEMLVPRRRKSRSAVSTRTRTTVPQLQV